MTLRIAIVGAGAIGAHVGAYLEREGHDLTLIDIWPEHVEVMRTDGLTLKGMTEPECFTIKMNAIHVTELQQVAKAKPFDIAFLSPKSYDTVWHTALIAPYLSEDGFCVSLQNSINEERIASIVGWDKVVGCIASTIAVELDQPGHVIRNVALGGDENTIFRIGEPHNRITKRIELIAEILRPCDSAKTTKNLWGERWTKLCVNAMRNPVAAATGRGGNANDHDPTTRLFSILLAGEAVRVGRSYGFNIEDIYKITPDQLLAALDGNAIAMNNCETIIIENASHRNDNQRPSMGQDIRKGRRTEIEYISGLIVKMAKKLALSTPNNSKVLEIVRKIERGDMVPSPGVITKIFDG